MANPSLMLNDRFWTILESIDSLESEVPLEYFLEELQKGPENSPVDEGDLNSVISFLASLDYPVLVTERDGRKYISPPASKSKRVFIDLSFTQWLAFQAHFPLLGEHKGKAFHTTIVDKLSEVEAAHPKYDLFKVIEKEKEKQNFMKQLHSNELTIVNKIEEAIDGHFNLEVGFKAGNQVSAYPHKVVYIDGTLSLIGEDIFDRCLVCFSIDEIGNLDLSTTNDYRVNFSMMEIDDFISALRAVTGNEERLVLKISTSQNLDLKPPHHFLGNPYVTSNMEGDLIWGASVEVSADLFDWLLTIKDQIEILDPQSVREQFELFCKERDQKIPLKKAS
ncbi:MAG: WYL domain-containing protein [Halobacteriovoraceae bacterium]|nr:WYL domain-containing protein [Halobacteriovoraceae bacterium]